MQKRALKGPSISLPLSPFLLGSEKRQSHPAAAAACRGRIFSAMPFVQGSLACVIAETELDLLTGAAEAMYLVSARPGLNGSGERQGRCFTGSVF